MTEITEPRVNGGPRPRVRDDDARGAPPGSGTVTPPHGGRIGNPPFVATEEQRQKVRTLAKTFPTHARHMIARLIGISLSTLDRHFGDDMEMGRAEMLAAVGAQMIQRALNGDEQGGRPSKGDIDAQKFILARLGGWSTKVELAGQGGGPIRHMTYDTSMLSDAERRALLPVLDQIIGDGQTGGDGDAS